MMRGSDRRQTGGVSLLLWLLLCCALLLSVTSANAQPVETSPNLKQTIEQTISRLLSDIKALKLDFRTLKLTYAEAQTKSQELESRLRETLEMLQNSENSLGMAQTSLSESITYSTQLEAALADLQTSFNSYVAAVNRKLLTTAILWLIIGIAAGGAAGIILE